MSLISYSQKGELGLFQAQEDIGSVHIPGGGSYDSKTQEYILYGSGENMWFRADGFHFMFRKMKGDFILRAQVSFFGKGVEAHRKIGWMIRPSLDSTSAQVSAVVHGEGLVSLQYREQPGDSTRELQTDIDAADVIQLERDGDLYTMSVARFGSIFETRQVKIDLGDQVFAGIFICSHNNDVSERAIFHNVRIIIPAKKNFVPYRDYIGSNLEVMNVNNGHSLIEYHTNQSIQAPNWMKNGKSLVFNKNGLMYRFDLSNHTIHPINTAPVNSNNNDHVISFNGRMLGLSASSNQDSGHSIVYVVPIGGGTPRRITPLGPSYLHGWSPDGKYLVFTGLRNGDFDIYRMSLYGTKETRLTHAPGLDDGPEYAPNGRFIYFNSVRSGMMQIWRMNSDGSNKEQLTGDDYNNWFPHVSPDGKWVVFISFPREVKPDDHPFYKHVYLRIMPANGGVPKVIGYVYGGQGTINTPSWSPDSMHIAFISNSAPLP